jgi:hypothetical protein
MYLKYSCQFQDVFESTDEVLVMNTDTLEVRVNPTGKLYLTNQLMSNQHLLFSNKLTGTHGFYYIHIHLTLICQNLFFLLLIQKIEIHA